MPSVQSPSCDVAQGLSHGHVSFGLKPWDHIPSFFVREAGGRVTTVRGDENWDIFHDNIFASNGQFHDEMVERFVRVLDAQERDRAREEWAQKMQKRWVISLPRPFRVILKSTKWQRQEE